MSRAAREKFKKGDRVRMSVEGEYRFSSRGGSKRGVVVGFGHIATRVRILRDGLKTPEAWHLDFWEVETKEIA